MAPHIHSSDAEQLAALRLPFPISDVKEREQAGQTLSYYEHNTVQNRLLDVFGTGMSLTTAQYTEDTENKILHLEVLLEVQWVSGLVSKVSGWGSAAIRKNGEPYKSAFSDAVKVAASKLGCGLELYDEDYRKELCARMEALRAAEAERLLLTCQDKGCIIEGCVFGDKELSAKDVALSTRKTFGKRLCVACAMEAKAAKVAA